MTTSTAATPPREQADTTHMAACAPALPVGLVVYTRDGRRLGRIKEAHERCFLIDVRFAFDYWLSMRAVAAVAGGRVLLGVDKGQVGEYLVDVDCLDDFEHLEPVAPGGEIAGLVPAAS